MAKTYFQDLFKSDCDNNTDDILRLIPRCNTRDVNSELEDKKILRAFD